MYTNSYQAILSRRIEIDNFYCIQLNITTDYTKNTKVKSNNKKKFGLNTLHCALLRFTGKFGNVALWTI